MKLIYSILLRLSVALSVLLTGWATFFYMAVMDEVNDEVDDSLEDYAEAILRRALAGEELPSKNSASNNYYFLREVPAAYVEGRSLIVYADSMVYIPDKHETEPARILTTLFKDDGDRWFELSVAIPHIERADLKEAITGWLVFLYVTLLVALVAIFVWAFHRNLRPLYGLLHWLDHYRIGASNEPLHNPTAITEFRKLNEAAVRYAQRSEQLFEQQKQFIGNASHEMQTPLSICRNRLEMLMEDESLSPTQLEELLKTYHTLEHLTKLNKTLLLLSKIENGQFADRTTVDVGELLKRYLSDYEEVFQHLDLQVTWKEQGHLTLEMNEMLAVVLLTNLLKNAFVHNRPGGRILLEVMDRSVRFCNTGVDRALDGERIFERFYQGEKKEGGTGLGLALADTICRMEGLQLQYAFCDGLHIFRLSGT